MEVFVINLEESSDRKKLFDERNAQYMGKYNYFNAVNGKKLNISELNEDIFEKKSINYSNGALGAALSHLNLWDKCIENNKPIIIMEDDVIVNYEYKKHLENVLSMLPEDFDILQLSYNFDSVLSFHNTIYEQCHSLFAKLRHAFGIAAYIVSPKGAKILKEKCFPLNNKLLQIPFLNIINCFTIDCMMNTAYKDISAYICIIPFIMTPHISDEYKSTIS